MKAGETKNLRGASNALMDATASAMWGKDEAEAAERHLERLEDCRRNGTLTPSGYFAAIIAYARLGQHALDRDRLAGAKARAAA